MARSLISMLLLVAGCSGPTAADTVTVPTTDGRSVEASVHLPEGSGKNPCLVVAPGGGYHRGLPIFTDLAEQGTAAGLVVVSFDWHFFSRGERPSAGQADEVADLEAVVAFARSHPRVDPERIVLAGKSFGSGVAHRVFEKDDRLVGLLLFTPSLRQEADLSRLYAEAASGSRPTVIVVGDADPACPLDVLYRALGQAPRPLPVVVVGGNHGLELSDDSAPGLEEANIRLANRAALHHLRLMLR